MMIPTKNFTIVIMVEVLATMLTPAALMKEILIVEEASEETKLGEEDLDQIEMVFIHQGERKIFTLIYAFWESQKVYWTEQDQETRLRV